MAFTYDPGTTIGQVRLLIPDTESAAALFSDEELSVLLGLAEDDPREAAATALETIARDRGLRLAKRIQVGGYSSESHAVSDLLAAAARLREGGSLQQLRCEPMVPSDEWLQEAQ